MTGLDKFSAHFAPFPGHYVLIGGTAALLALEEADLKARATKDLDIVLCAEALNTGFAAAFWDFVKAGGYQQRERSNGKKEFYRFQKPSVDGYPYMLELFSRIPDGLVLPADAYLTPIPMDEDVGSLSAILLNEDYYHFIHEHKHELAGVQVVDPYGLIALKARAWLDLSDRREAGEEVDQKNINKHANDVLRLYQLIRPTDRTSAPESIRTDLSQFLDRALADKTDQVLKNLDIHGTTMPAVIETLRRAFGA